MFRFARAAAYAVASLMVAASPTFVAPLHARNIEASSPAPHSTADATASTNISSAIEAQLPPLAAEAELVPISTPIAAVPDKLLVIEPVLRSLGELVDAHDDQTRIADGEHECLAGAIYFESKGEPLEGQLAVAEVVINRSQSGKYPKTLCGVIKQRHQFSFIRAGQFPPIQRATAAWRKAVAIAHIALRDLADSRAAKAMFFHAKYVSPKWRGLTRVAAVGNHIFYR